MAPRKRLAVSGVLILAALTTLVLVAGIAFAQATNPGDQPAESAEALEAAASVSGVVPIQGKLMDSSGNPLSGNYTIQARIYDASTGGTVLCEDVDSVAVEAGLFNMYLDGSGGCSSGDIDGTQLYLGITVGSDPEMTPRQGIYPVPYAWTLRPGAIISGTTAGASLHIENSYSTGRGIRSYATSTTGTNYGIVGASRSPDGYGGYFYNTAAAGDGVYGEGWFGVYGSGTSAGVRGETTNGYGVYGLSTNGDGVGASTLSADNNYGFYTADNLFSLNIHTAGAEMQVVQNAGLVPVETGDVVAFHGIDSPLKSGGPPVIQVAAAESAGSTAVAGVVYSRYNIAALQAGAEDAVQEYTAEGPVAPGEYLLVVVRGPAQVKAGASAGPLQPGDLVSSAARAGYAGKAEQVSLGGVETAMPGTILGKALEPLEAGEALIYIYVTLQ